MLVETNVCVPLVFVWEETGVPGGNILKHHTIKVRFSTFHDKRFQHCKRSFFIDKKNNLKHPQTSVYIYLVESSDCRSISIFRPSSACFCFSLHSLLLSSSTSISSFNFKRRKLRSKEAEKWSNKCILYCTGQTDKAATITLWGA